MYAGLPSTPTPTLLPGDKNDLEVVEFELVEKQATRGTENTVPQSRQ